MHWIKYCLLISFFLSSPIFAAESGSTVALGVHGSGINGLSFSMNPVLYSTSNIYELETSYAQDFYLKYNIGISGGRIAAGWIFWSSPDGPRVDIYKNTEILPFPWYPFFGLGIDFQVVKIYNSGDNKFLNGFADRNIVYYGTELGFYFIGAFKISAYTSFTGSNHFCISYGIGL